ncbi:MAG: hypothetical protein KDD94_10220 [Calditrichaeota bacterium]|nr:hypothetical protein [Calditrichota bacterium]
MITLYQDKALSYSSKQMLAINQFYHDLKFDDESIDYEEALYKWLTEGYAEKFRSLYVLEKLRFN